MFTNEFISLCKEFAQKRSHILSEEIKVNKKLCAYKIEFYNYLLEFRYIKKESAFIKPSSLYCVIYLRKNSIVHYHLPDIIPFLENKTFKSCYFWNIESPERLKNCFDSLVSVLETVLIQLSPSLSEEPIISAALFNSYKMIYNLKSTDIDFSKADDPEDYAHFYFSSLQNTRDGFIFSRYSNFRPYALLLKNKTDKALKKYEKLSQKHKLFDYEKLLIDHVLKSKDGFHPFDPACDTSLSDAFMSHSAILKAFFVCFFIFSIFFCSSFAIYNAIISISAVLILSAPWYMGFLCAALPSVFGAIAFFVHMPDKRLTRKERQDFSKILISKGVKKLSFILFFFSIAASIFFSVMMLTSNVRFYDDGIKFSGKSYSYSQIDSVYHIDARYNMYGDRINRASYVILFDDETSLDLDGYTSVKYTEKEVLPLLKNKGFEVNFADSERELPWYSDQ